METKNITRKAAAAIINNLTHHLDEWTRDATGADRGAILSHLFDLVQRYDIPVPHPCGGKAHTNPSFDHCGVCMPNWGTVRTPVRVR